MKDDSHNGDDERLRNEIQAVPGLQWTVLTEEQRLGLIMLYSSMNVDLTGPGGVGKTKMFLKEALKVISHAAE